MSKIKSEPLSTYILSLCMRAVKVLASQHICAGTPAHPIVYDVTSTKNMSLMCWLIYYPPTKSEGYSFGVVRPFRPSVHTFCLSGTISQYLMVRFDLFLVQMISTMNSRYPISLVKIDSLTLELLHLFKYRQL